MTYNEVMNASRRMELLGSLSSSQPRDPWFRRLTRMSSTTGLCQECLEEDTLEFCPEVFERLAKEEAEMRSFMATSSGEEGPRKLRRLNASRQLGASLEQQPQPADNHLREWDFGHHILDELISKYEGWTCPRHRAAAEARECGYGSQDVKPGKVLTWDDVCDEPIVKLPSLFPMIGAGAVAERAAAAAAAAAVTAVADAAVDLAPAPSCLVKRKGAETLVAKRRQPSSSKTSGCRGPGPGIEETDPIECNSPLAPMRVRFARPAFLTSGKVRQPSAAQARTSDRDQKKSIKPKKCMRREQQLNIRQFFKGGKDGYCGDGGLEALGAERSDDVSEMCPEVPVFPSVVDKVQAFLRQTRGHPFAGSRTREIPDEEKLFLAHCWGCTACKCPCVDEDGYLGKQQLTYHREHIEFRCYFCCADRH